jgi:hypothetical protein
MKTSVLLFVLTSIAYCYKCDIKKCATKHLTENTCVSPTRDETKNITIFEININNCPEGKICPYVADSSKDLQCNYKAIQFSRYDGQACTNNTHCASNDCNSGKCLGKPESSPCNQNSECRIGFFCGTKDLSSGVRNCLPQRALNNTCESDEECLNNMGCVNNKCVEYFSQPVGTYISDAGFRVCQTGKIYDGYCISMKLASDVEECMGEQAFCKYNTEGLPDKKSIDLRCQCSDAYSDKNFCDIDSFRAEWVKFLEKMKDWYSQHNRNYHTDMRHNYHMDLYKMYKKMTMYPQHKDAEDCLVNWELSELSGGFVSLCLAAVFLCLMIIL